VPLDDNIHLRARCTSTGGGNATLTTNDNDVNKQGGPSTVVVTGSGPAFQVGIELHRPHLPRVAPAPQGESPTPMPDNETTPSPLFQQAEVVLGNLRTLTDNLRAEVVALEAKRDQALADHERIKAAIRAVKV